MPNARPVLKWAGGKGQLLDRLQPLFPPKFNRYIEPFAGAGAVFFRLYNLGLIGTNPRLRKLPALLNDVNPELIIVYQAIRDHLDELITELARHQAHTTESEYYYFIRKLDRDPAYLQQSTAIRAARMIFLNKTGYNGLYRVNRSGQFNVPFGSHKNPRVLDLSRLQAVHQALQYVELTCTDFAQALRQARRGDFVYLDPPYHPVSNTSFTSYTSNGFSWEDQERLVEWISRLVKRGCRVLVNNADTPETRELYRSLGQVHQMSFEIKRHETLRSINSRAHERRGSMELTMWN